MPRTSWPSDAARSARALAGAASRVEHTSHQVPGFGQAVEGWLRSSDVPPWWGSGRIAGIEIVRWTRHGTMLPGIGLGAPLHGDGAMNSRSSEQSRPSRTRLGGWAAESKHGPFRGQSIEPRKKVPSMLMPMLCPCSCSCSAVPMRRDRDETEFEVGNGRREASAREGLSDLIESVESPGGPSSAALCACHADIMGLAGARP